VNYTHTGILDYLTQYRVAHAQRLLVTTDLPVLEIALACGFNSLSRFYAAFKKICGRSPRTYRQEHDALREGRLVALLNSLDEWRRPGEPGRS
jgi:transcriptional regulator GlxA family with amidase domain